MDMRGVVRAMGWVVTGGVLLVVVLYAALVALNWSDEAPSADALAMQRLLDSPPVADEDNGYVYVLGLSVAEGEDPLAWGRRRKAYLEHFPAQGRAGFDIPGERHRYAASRPPAVATLSRSCRRGGSECLQLLERDPAVLAAWLASEAWLLERYRQLLQRTQWREVVPTDPAAPLPAYQYLLAGQELLLLEAWQQARAGEAQGVDARLRQDLEFWRMVLRSSDLLITKMIATAAVDRHFALGSLALRALAEKGGDSGMPALWRVPIGREERAMYRAFAGEWQWGANALRAARDAPFDEASTAGDRILDWLQRPLLKPQATQNLTAARLLGLARRLDAAEYAALPQVVADTAAAHEPALWEALHLYNPTGHLLEAVATGIDYGHYGLRTADLEGARRAAVLAAALRGDGIEASGAEEALAASPLKDPYTGLPLQWDADTASVVFVGQAPGERQRCMVPL